MNKTVIVSCFLFRFLFFFPSEFASDSHQAGSAGDQALADRVFRKFKEYSMKCWADEHFVKVQDPPASGFNKLIFKNGNEERLDGFLSYSATGTVKVINMLN